MVKEKTCVFISGAGTNLRSIIKNSRDYNFPVKISLVISNNINAAGINFAFHLLFLMAVKINLKEML